MNAATNPAPATMQPAEPTKRTRIFSRTYDYSNGTVTLKSEGRDDVMFKATDLSDEVLKSFGLKAYADYLTGSANRAMAEEGATVDAAYKALDDAAAEAVAGKIEFRDGTAVGTTSAPAATLVGRALVELGKSFVMFKGVKHSFANADEAKGVMAMLYADTAENTVDAHKKTGRQFFNLISEREDVAKLVNSYKKPKASVAAVTADALG